jgi:hypothetical protein
MTMRTSSQTTLALAAVALIGLAAPAAAEVTPGPWRQTVFVYGMGAAVDGGVEFGNLAVPVNVSRSDFLEDLRFGAMAAYRIDNDVWSFTGDVTWFKLRSEQDTEQGRAGARIENEQITAMATVGRRVGPNLEALFSLAYFDVQADAQVRVLQQTLSASRDASWVDPLIGFAYEVPFSNRWRFTLRGDIGGFGVGSEKTYHALTRVTYQASDSLSWYAGYRVISYDFEEGEGRGFQRFDLRQHGPGLGVAFKF